MHNGLIAHTSIITRKTSCPGGLGVHWHDHPGEGWDTQIVKLPQLICRQTHELNKCYCLMPQWFCSVWLHSITVTIANWYNCLLAIWHPGSCFTFLNPSFLINKWKWYFVLVKRIRADIYCSVHRKCSKMIIFMLLLSLH